MSELQTWRAKRQKEADSLQQMRDKLTRPDYEPTNEDKENWEAVNRAFDIAHTKVEALQDVRKFDSHGNSYGGKVPGDEDRRAGDWKGNKRGLDPEGADAESLATHAWLLRSAGKRISDDHQRAVLHTGLDLGAAELEIDLGEQRSQTVGTTTEGGYLRPTTLAKSLELALTEFNCMRQAADIFTTEGGELFDYPTCNDVANVGTQLAENTTIGSAVDMVFSKVTFSAWKWTSGLVLLSQELIEDNQVGLVKILGGMLGERLGRGTEGAYTTGAGTTTPKGVVVASSLGCTTASATAFTADEVYDLMASVDPAYRNRPGAGFMMHDNVVSIVRKMKDGLGRYLIDADGFRNNMPQTIFGRPFWVNQSMRSTVTTAQKVMLYGDYKQFKIRQVGKVRIRRFDELYAGSDNVGFIGLMRTDSNLLTAGVPPIRHMLTA